MYIDYEKYSQTLEVVTFCLFWLFVTIQRFKVE